ncbi:MAG: chemotaxis protein CheA [Spirochaetales bacterium]|nr:chemotaxis protein CheA [Spirochaetales bacterium]
MKRKSKEDALGKDFADLIDEKEQDELVRRQLLEITADAKSKKAAPPPAVVDLGEPAAPADEPVLEPAVVDISEPRPPAAEPIPAPTVVAGLDEPATVEIDDLSLMNSFLQEMNEHLENIEEKIVRLERSNDAGLVDEIFRSMHTIKGTSGFFGFQFVTKVSHETESLLEDLRSGEIEMSPAVADLLLAAADHLKGLAGDISKECARHDPQSVPFTITEPTRDISEFMSRIVEARGGSGLAATGAGQPVPSSGPNELVSQEMVDSFKVETDDLLSQAESQLLQLENSPGNLDLIDHTFRCVHTIKGNAGFLGYATIEQVCMNLEDILDVLRKGDRVADQSMVTALLRTVDSLRRSVTRVTFGEQDPAGAASSADDGEDQYRPLGEMLVDLGLATEEAVGQALEEQDRKLGEILVAKGDLSEEVLNDALNKQKQALASSGRQESMEHKEVRVDVSKLDRLFDLMGELITAEAMVVQNPDLQGMELNRFDQAAAYLGKITRQMQEITMSVRMIPMEGMFNKMRRVVRDLARRMERPIEFHDSGRDTEMDRNVIEVLSDPLVHLIRNAVDHGIETSADRQAAGKPAEGRVHLGARYEGSEIWISVRDDGRGLNREKILSRAISQGLTTEEEAASFADDHIWQFLFQPGFSTAEQVSDVSGRGVGMDVVKRNIEELRGKVDVVTTPGEGTEVILKIPLTLAIIDGVTVKVGNVLYAIPLGDIREFHQARSDQLSPITAGGEVLKLREEIIPVIRLRKFFSTGHGEDELGAGIFIVVQSSNGRAALLVDEIIGYHQIVVKSLPEYMGAMQGLSGCSVLGNGEVSLIIDTSSLMKGRAA